MFFTQKLVLVEGLEDIAYIHGWLVVTGNWQQFRQSGVHIVAANKKSEMVRPAVIAMGLGICTMGIFDADGDKITKADANGLQSDNTSVRHSHQKDNLALIRVFGGDESNPFPTGVVWSDHLVIWPSDFGSVVREECRLSLGPQGEEQFIAIANKARNDAGDAAGLEKNAMYIGFLLERLRAAKAHPLSLDKLCQKILAM